MRIQSIKTLIIGALLSSGALFMSNCKNDKNLPNGEVLREYMIERGNTEEEIDSIIKTTVRRSLAREDAAKQSALDSIAYRDLFYETQFSSNPAIVSDFNKIASKMKLENSIAYYNNAELRSREGFVDALTKEGVKKEEIDSLLKNFPSRKNLFSYDFSDIQNYQHYSDKCFYSSFFEKLGLMKGDFKSKFEALANKIAPKK